MNTFTFLFERFAIISHTAKKSSVFIHKDGNMKFEARNPKQAQMAETKKSKTRRLRFGFIFLDFEFVSDFDIRISDLFFIYVTLILSKIFSWG
jgi:hypothetical protein